MSVQFWMHAYTPKPPPRTPRIQRPHRSAIKPRHPHDPNPPIGAQQPIGQRQPTHGRNARHTHGDSTGPTTMQNTHTMRTRTPRPTSVPTGGRTKRTSNRRHPATPTEPPRCRRPAHFESQMQPDTLGGLCHPTKPSPDRQSNTPDGPTIGSNLTCNRCRQLPPQPPPRPDSPCSRDTPGTAHAPPRPAAPPPSRCAWGFAVVPTYIIFCRFPSRSPFY